jgi:hypothetical protein
MATQPNIPNIDRNYYQSLHHNQKRARIGDNLYSRTKYYHR